VRRDDERLAASGSPQSIQSEATMRLPGVRNERERQGTGRETSALPGEEFCSQTMVVELREYAEGVVFVKCVDT
jgi:hypothetical protein